MDKKINNISFQAKLGKNILKKVSKEFEYDKNKVSKYSKLFENTFISNIDKNTIIDINKNDYFVFSNSKCPNIKYQYKYSKLMVKNNIAETLLNECSKIFVNAENNLFKVIIGNYLRLGKNVPFLEDFANSAISNPKSKKNFMENLNIAKRIMKENPNSKLLRYEFDYMINKIMQEEAQNPQSELYKIINNFKGFDFI